MFQKRIIPCLLLKDDGSLYKTRKFKNPRYIGDPINTISIFNDYEVDEIILLDIDSSKKKNNINFDLLEKIANECFVPLAYGGGVSNLSQVERILSGGFEKIVLNSVLFENISFLDEVIKRFGSQAVIASVDVKKYFLSDYRVYSHSGKKIKMFDPFKWVKFLEDKGVGEILLTIVDREGTWDGFDVDFIERISSSTDIPLIASGGAAKNFDVDDIFNRTSAQAVSVGNMVVFQKKGMGVLINFPF